MESTNPDQRVPVRRYSEPFRSRRIQSPAFAKGLAVSFEYQNKPIKGVGQDLSAGGVRATFPTHELSKGETLRVGESLDGVRVSFFDRAVFEGDACVRHVNHDQQECSIGLELNGMNVAIHSIQSDSVRLDLRYRLDLLLRDMAELTAQVESDFEQWLLDSKAALSKLRDFLDQEEKSWAHLDWITRHQNVKIILDEAGKKLVPLFNDFRDALNFRVAKFSEAEHKKWRPIFRQHLGELFMACPFTHRAFHKPMGYAGDYELMSMLYRAEPEGDSLFAKVLNMHSKDEPAGRATINRLEYLGGILSELATSTEAHPLEVASIGCGAARELVHLLTRKPELGPKLKIALVDQDSRALDLCERTLTPLSRKTGARFSFIGDPIQSLIQEKNLGDCLGKRDLIYSAGLYDYLEDDVFVALTRVLYDALKPGAKLVIGNMANHNPTKEWMAYAMDWYLIHRSPDELMELGTRVTSDSSKVFVDSEPEGVNLFVHLRR